MSTVSNAIQNLGLINGLLSTSVNQPEPVVGMGCTMFYGSDRRPYTIVEVSKSGGKIRLVADTYKKVAGSAYGDESYVITPGVLEEGSTPYMFRKCKDGRFRPVGSSMKERAIMVGDRQMYYDPSF